MTVKYGLIAEDNSDIKVIKVLAKKVSGRNITSAQFVGKGCGAIRRKAPGWCKAFHEKGCTQILLVHDRDRSDAAKLQAELEEILKDAPQPKRVVVVPSEEIEAWLLSDQGAIKTALNMRQAFKEVHHPETVKSPKEHLGDLVWKASGKKITYVNSVHNPLIAELADIKSISKKCPSFKPFEKFFE